MKYFSYQYGPDTYLLQLRDTNFPARLREYIKVAKGRSPSFNYSITDSNYDLSVSLCKLKKSKIVTTFEFYSDANYS
jgi:hypothetical protein